MLVARACAAIVLFAFLVDAQVESDVVKQVCTKAVTGSVDTSNPYSYIRTLTYDLEEGERDLDVKLGTKVCTTLIGVALTGLKIKACDYVLPTLTTSPKPYDYSVHVQRNGDARGTATVKVEAVCAPTSSPYPLKQ